MSMTAKYIRNGAWAGVGFYLISAVVLLTLSASYDRVQPHPASRELSAASLQHIGQALPAVLHS